MLLLHKALQYTPNAYCNPPSIYTALPPHAPDSKLLGLQYAAHLCHNAPSSPTILAAPPQTNDEHRQCHPGGGVYLLFSVLLCSNISYTTPLNSLFILDSFLVVIYDWWSPYGNAPPVCIAVWWHDFQTLTPSPVDLKWPKAVKSNQNDPKTPKTTRNDQKISPKSTQGGLAWMSGALKGSCFNQGAAFEKFVSWFSWSPWFSCFPRNTGI